MQKFNVPRFSGMENCKFGMYVIIFLINNLCFIYYQNLWIIKRNMFPKKVIKICKVGNSVSDFAYFYLKLPEL